MTILTFKVLQRIHVILKFVFDFPMHCTPNNKSMKLNLQNIKAGVRVAVLKLHIPRKVYFIQYSLNLNAYIMAAVRKRRRARDYVRMCCICAVLCVLRM